MVNDVQSLDENLARTIAATPDLFHLPADLSRADFSMRRIGGGESHVSWRLDIAEQAYVLRAPRDSGRDMSEEFLALSHVPAGLAPEAIALVQPAESGLSIPVMVQTFVSGRVMPVSWWDESKLAQLGGHLASLHARTYPGHGPVTAAFADGVPAGLRHLDGESAGSGQIDGAQNRPSLQPQMNPIVLLEERYEYWRDRAPELVEGGAGKRLEPLVREYVEAHAQTFESIPFALLHGDVITTNILVNGDDMTLIDWEWAQIGDPARDLAVVGALRAASPWYLALTQHKEAALIRGYLDAGGNGTERELTIRRRVHEVIEHLSNALYFVGRLDVWGGLPPVTMRQRPIFESAARELFRAVQERCVMGLTSVGE